MELHRSRRASVSQGDRLRVRALRPTPDPAVGQGSRGTFARIGGGAAAYFTLVFCTGFVLGILRVLVLEPKLGVRIAELAEMPLMLVTMVAAARWTIRRFNVQREPRTKLWIGLGALALLLAAEIATLVVVRGHAISDFVLTRDPVSGTVYFLMLALFAAMPTLVSRFPFPRQPDA